MSSSSKNRYTKILFITNHKYLITSHLHEYTSSHFAGIHPVFFVVTLIRKACMEKQKKVESFGRIHAKLLKLNNPHWNDVR